MGLRYRKVISLGPWFRVNVSGSGLSFSVGPRGKANMNFSPVYGTSGNVRLPGGFYWRKFFGKGKGK